MPTAPAASSTVSHLTHAVTSSSAMKDVAPAFDAMLIDNAFNLVAAIVILAVGWTLAVWTRRWIRAAFGRFRLLDPSLGPILASLARYAILALTVMAVLGRFGVELTSLIAVLGAVGLAVGLALQGTLSNVASGLMILLLRPFRAGDTVEILGTAGTLGTVTEIGLFRTLVIAIDARVLSVPNATLFTGTIVNYSQEPRYRLDVTVPVDMTNDIAAVRRAFLDEAKSDDRILALPPPVVGVTELGDYGATILVRIWTRYALSQSVAWDLRERLQARMRKDGIAFAVPRQATAARSETDLAPAITGAEPDDGTPRPEARPSRH